MDLFFKIYENKKMDLYLHMMVCHSTSLIKHHRGNIHQFSQYLVEKKIGDCKEAYKIQKKIKILF